MRGGNRGGAHTRSPRLPRPNNPHGTHYNLAWQQQRVSAAEGSIMPLVGHGLGILGLEEPPDVLPVLGVVVRAQVKAKLEVLEELTPARASGRRALARCQILVGTTIVFSC